MLIGFNGAFWEMLCNVSANQNDFDKGTGLETSWEVHLILNKGLMHNKDKGFSVQMTGNL